MEMSHICNKDQSVYVNTMIAFRNHVVMSRLLQTYHFQYLGLIMKTVKSRKSIGPKKDD